jgi:hypothetical protein
MNQNTRALYDKEITKSRSVTTSKPMKYMTTQLTEERKLVDPDGENIDVDSQLRMAPTRLNYLNRPETELYGTAPYKLRGQSPLVDVESQLRYPSYNQYCNSKLTEERFDTFDFINDPVSIDFRARSSRVDLRNSYCEKNITKS